MSKVFGIIISILMVIVGITFITIDAPIFGVGTVCCGILALILIFGGNKI